MLANLKAIPPVNEHRKAVKLNLGCGRVHALGWINVDGSNRAWLASRVPWLDRFLVFLRLLPPTEFSRQTLFADISTRLPWLDDSVDAIYMGEVLEHFTREEGERLIKECYRVLRPKGVLRIRVPDNARFWSNYLAEYKRVKQLPSSERTLDHTRWIGMFFDDICVRPEPLRFRGHYHKWMYDDVSLVKTLELAGFVDAERRNYLESRIPDIERVEVRDDLIVEARKPQGDTSISVQHAG
jgi:predicted SAM-dependent methyltransferase